MRLSAAALDGDLSLAGTLWGAIGSFESAYGSRMHAADRVRYERLLGKVKATPAFVAAYERGRELTEERALERAQQAADEPRRGRDPAVAS